MKTTIEIPDYQWAKLQQLATACGDDDPSGLVREAVTAYLVSRVPAEMIREEQQRRAELPDRLPEDYDADSMYQILREGRRYPQLVEAALATFGAALKAHDNALSDPWYLDALREYLVEREHYELRHAEKVTRPIGKQASDDEVAEQLAEQRATVRRVTR